MIYDSLKPKQWQLDEPEKVDVKKLMKKYPEMSQDRIDMIALESNEKLFGAEHISSTYEAVVYKFSDKFLKYHGFTEALADPLREAIIGLEINSLNSEFFVKTIGYHIESDKCLPRHRGSEGKCIYIYVKKVEGLTLKEFIATSSLSQFKNIVRKLLTGYKTARDKLDFCHYDLHASNIIVTRDLVPVIIDFGSSHIRIGNENIGEQWPEVGRYSNISLWVYDFFKIFAFCWEYTSEKAILESISEDTELFHDELERTLDGIRNKPGKTGKTRFRQKWNDEEDDWEETEETLNEYLDRLSTIDPELGRNIKNWIEESLTKIDKRKTSYEENKRSLGKINGYCMKILGYFREDITEDWLWNYRSHISPSWGSSVTEKGRDTSFDDFINFVDTLD